MARTRKTVGIAALLKRTNHKLLLSTCSPDVRSGMISVLTGVLHDANVYAGFGYLSRADLKRADRWAEDPGIEFRNPEGKECLADVYYAELAKAKEGDYICRYTKKFPDESRRFYYIHRALLGDYHKLAADGEK